MATEDKILELYKTTKYQKLNAYYGQSTVFNILGIERSENRHSAFLAWLLNPISSHGLKENPLRKFLSLVATKATDEEKCYYHQVREHLITGNYSLQVESIKTEQSIIGLANGNTDDFKGVVETNDKGLFKKDSKNRFDIWMLLHITFIDEYDQEKQWYLPIVVENKIYSVEGNADDKEKAQTVRYHRAVNILKNIVCPGTNYVQPLLVFLTPSDAKKPTNNAFIHLTYQDMLDHVIQPCSILSLAQGVSLDVKNLMDGYIRNLSCPSNKDGEKTKDYSILAIADTEDEDLQCIFKSEAFLIALCAIYPNEAKKLLDKDYKVVEEDLPLLEQFWNANEDLFKIVLYNQFKDDEESMKTVQRIVKVNNRDNTRYYVGPQQGKWLNTKGRPASMSEASFLIFKAYCLLQEEKQPSAELTVDHLRSKFDCSLNAYYHNRFLQHLFYDFDDEVTVDVKTNKHFGAPILPESDTWDFYWDDDHILPHVKGEVRSVKMWHKEDFDALVKKAKEYGIVVEPAE